MTGTRVTWEFREVVGRLVKGKSRCDGWDRYNGLLSVFRPTTPRHLQAMMNTLFEDEIREGCYSVHDDMLIRLLTTQYSTNNVSTIWTN